MIKQISMNQKIVLSMLVLRHPPPACSSIVLRLRLPHNLEIPLKVLASNAKHF